MWIIKFMLWCQAIDCQLRFRCRAVRTCSSSCCLQKTWVQIFFVLLFRSSCFAIDWSGVAWWCMMVVMCWVEITQCWYSVDMLWWAIIVDDGGTEYSLSYFEEANIWWKNVAKIFNDNVLYRFCWYVWYWLNCICML